MLHKLLGFPQYNEEEVAEIISASPTADDA